MKSISLLILFSIALYIGGTTIVISRGTVSAVTRVEIHVGILSTTGEKSYGEWKSTYHLTDGYKVANSNDSAIIVSQLVYVNQVLNHGAPKDSLKFPFTYFFPVAQSKRGNNITENLISIKNLRDTTGVHDWLIRITDRGYGPHTHIETDKTHKLSLKIICPNI